MKIITNRFESAQKNMDFDAHLINERNTNSWLRIYLWEKPGVTQAFNKNIPDHLKKFDHAKRCSGGGIVFHHPNDLLLTWISPIEREKNIITNKLNRFKKFIMPFISPYLKKYSRPIKKQDINYCQHYHSHFELFSNQDKVYAVAARKKNQHLLIQAIIHRGVISPEFLSLNEYQLKKSHIPTKKIYNQLLKAHILTALT